MKFIVEIPDNEIGTVSGRMPTPEQAAEFLQEDLRDQSDRPGLKSALTVTPLQGMRVAVVIDGGCVESVHFSPKLEGLQLAVIDHDVMKVDDGLDHEEREEVQEIVTDGLIEVPWKRAQQPQFENHYCHEDCQKEPGISWTDTWSCGCDDECPACGASISPHESVEIAHA